MRCVVMPADRYIQDGSLARSWVAQVEWGPGFCNTWTAYGPDPLSAAMNLAEYIAMELESVREKARKL